MRDTGNTGRRVRPPAGAGSRLTGRPARLETRRNDENHQPAGKDGQEANAAILPASKAAIRAERMRVTN